MALPKSPERPEPLPHRQLEQGHGRHDEYKDDFGSSAWDASYSCVSSLRHRSTTLVGPWILGEIPRELRVRASMDLWCLCPRSPRRAVGVDSPSCHSPSPLFFRVDDLQPSLHSPFQCISTFWLNLKQCQKRGSDSAPGLRRCRLAQFESQQRVASPSRRVSPVMPFPPPPRRVALQL